MNDLVEILIPAIVFSTMTILVVILLIYKYKVKKLFLNVTQQSLQQNPEITPEVIREIANQVLRPTNDFKKSLILMGISAAILIASFIADFPNNGNMDLNHLINSMAAFPGVMGAVYLLLSKIDKD